MKKYFWPFSIALTFILALTFNISISAQVDQKVRCQTTIDRVQSRILSDPEYAKYVRQIDQKIKQGSINRSPECSEGPIIIPIAVHFDNDVVPSSQEPCAISLVEDQLSSLNIEINGNDPQNSAYGSLQTCFPGNPEIGQSCVEFCLATVNHPTGYGLTEGQVAITFGQIDFSNTVDSDSAVPIESDWAGYLNIFVGNLSGGLLGESAGIPGSFNGEGVVIDACTFGTGDVDCSGMNSSANCGGIYNEGNTLVHEVGHYLGLYHIWGDNSGCTGSQDVIDDTPGMTSSYGGYTDCNDITCSDLPESCSSKDMYMNYMSYAGDACMYMFTSDQSDKIYQVASAAGFSSDLPIQCATPEAPVANFDFTPDPAQLCPPTGIIDFTDISTGPPASWSWTFSGGGVSPISSNEKDPSITVSQDGVLTATLVVSNSEGQSPAFSQEINVSFLEENDPSCDLCSYQLNLEDSYGDGWNGASLEVLLDEVHEGNYTLTDGSNTTFYIDVIQGQNIELIYTGGDYDSEVSFDLLNPFETILFHQGSHPPDGTLYSALINCNAPTCDDGIQNGEELGIDCGGPDCIPCTDCTSIFTDSGGPEGNYSNNENTSYTLCPENEGEGIQLDFDYLDIENHASCSYDKLRIFNGSDNSQLIDLLCGSTNPGIIKSTSHDGCLYIEFESDGSIYKSGWEAQVHCTTACNIVSTTSEIGPGSLREAIECVYNGDTIFFLTELADQTLVLNNGELSIQKNIFIVDPTKSITIESNNSGVIFNIEASTFLHLEGIELRGSSSENQSIIENNGQLTLKNSTIKDVNNSGNSQSIINNPGASLIIEGSVKIQKE